MRKKATSSVTAKQCSAIATLLTELDGLKKTTENSTLDGFRFYSWPALAGKLLALCCNNSDRSTWICWKERCPITNSLAWQHHFNIETWFIDYFLQCIDPGFLFQSAAKLFLKLLNVAFFNTSYPQLHFLSWLMRIYIFTRFFFFFF